MMGGTRLTVESAGLLSRFRSNSSLGCDQRVGLVYLAGGVVVLPLVKKSRRYFCLDTQVC